MAIYNLGYYEGMLKNYSKTAEEICKIRWAFVKPIHAKSVLDYGSGIGWFRAFRPPGVEVDTYDIANYPQTGINNVSYDLICFWDVLEHLTSFAKIEALLYKAKFVALTVPILPADKDIKGWKHFKPGEHIKIFTHELLDALFGSYGYTNTDKSQPECPPREDIWSFIYERCANKVGAL